MSENIYVALIINKNNEPDLSQYERVISLFNVKYPNNKLVYDKYLIDGSIPEIDKSLDSFISKYPNGKRVTVSVTTTILTECSNYFVKNNLNILSISINATSNQISNLVNAITYTPFNQYSVMSMFMTYVDYQMHELHILYGESTNIGLIDYLEQIKIQAKLLNINLVISYLKKGQYKYNIKPKSLIVILALTPDLTNIYVTPEFLNNIPKCCFITLTTANTLIKDIFGNIPAIVFYPTTLKYTKTTKEVYDVVKNNPSGYDYTSYALYDVLFVLKNFSTNGLLLNKNNYITIQPYNQLEEPAWLFNTYIQPNLNSAPYGNYSLIFTKNVIINNDQELFMKYYDGGQDNLPDSYSLFRVAGITPNDTSLINYDEAYYYKIYDVNNKLLAVRFNNNITDFPAGKNLNIGTTEVTKFIYKYNEKGYFTKLVKLFECNEKTPQVNSTMSKIPINLLIKN